MLKNRFRDNFWFNGGWRDSQKLVAEAPIEKLPATNAELLADPLYVLFNPHCKHERCSYDIANCDSCIEYTKELLRLRIEGKDATDGEEEAAREEQSDTNHRLRLPDARPVSTGKTAAKEVPPNEEPGYNAE